MPTKWTPELDFILLNGIFEDFKIKFSKELCTKLAERVSAAGFECSYKAVENRLYSWKKKNTGGTTDGNGPSTPSKSSTPKTPASGRGRVKGSNKKKAQIQGDNHGVNDEDEVMSPSMSRKRSRGAQKSASYTGLDACEDDEEEKHVPLGKKVKQEEMDNQGCGAFAAASGDDRHQEA